MMKRKGIRLLITWVLAAAMAMALGSEAFASSGSRIWSIATIGAKATKSTTGPMVGEPDTPQGGPLPPKDGARPYIGRPSATGVLRFNWATIRVLLIQLPKRYP